MVSIPAFTPLPPSTAQIRCLSGLMIGAYPISIANMPSTNPNCARVSANAWPRNLLYVGNPSRKTRLHHRWIVYKCRWYDRQCLVYFPKPEPKFMLPYTKNVGKSSRTCHGASGRTWLQVKAMQNQGNAEAPSDSGNGWRCCGRYNRQYEYKCHCEG